MIVQDMSLVQIMPGVSALQTKPVKFPAKKAVFGLYERKEAKADFVLDTTVTVHCLPSTEGHITSAAGS